MLCFLRGVIVPSSRRKKTVSSHLHGGMHSPCISRELSVPMAVASRIGSLDTRNFFKRLPTHILRCTQCQGAALQWRHAATLILKLPSPPQCNCIRPIPGGLHCPLPFVRRLGCSLQSCFKLLAKRHVPSDTSRYQLAHHGEVRMPPLQGMQIRGEIVQDQAEGHQLLMLERTFPTAEIELSSVLALPVISGSIQPPPPAAACLPRRRSYSYPVLPLVQILLLFPNRLRLLMVLLELLLPHFLLLLPLLPPRPLHLQF